MRALTVVPGVKDSAAITDAPEPDVSDGPVLVESLAVGLCGTDVEIVAAEYGEAPPGADRLVLGHENLGRVVSVDPGTTGGPNVGDLVVGIVRRPDPVPCGACAAGEWDMCRNGGYVEHGIKGLHGFARERWRGQPDAMVVLDPSLGPLGVLLEPATVLAKAWEQLERIGARAYFDPKTVAITGAGPIGLLAALMGVQRGLEVHVIDMVTDGPKPQLVADLGATYHPVPLSQSGIMPDLVIECTGVGSVIVDAISHNASNGITCLTGVSTAGRTLPLDVGALNRLAVLENDVVFGSVNANRRHYEAGASALAAADPAWLGRLITRRVPLEKFADGFARHPDDVKVVVDIAS